MFRVSAALLVLFITHLSIDPSVCPLPANIQNLELDDITSLWNKFPSIIGKIQEAGRRTCDQSKAIVKDMLFDARLIRGKTKPFESICDPRSKCRARRDD